METPCKAGYPMQGGEAPPFGVGLTSKTKASEGRRVIDVARGEAVEAELDSFIELRDERRRTEEGERAAEEMWMESTRRHAAKLREAARAEWSLYYEHMSELHTQLAEEHRHKAEKLRQAETEAIEKGDAA